jgi:hypothetical protein
MVRGGVRENMASPAVRGSRIIRRKSLRLPQPGIELNIPSLPQIAVGWRAVSFLLVLAMAAALVFAWTSPRFTIEQPKVSGLKNLSTTDIMDILKLEGKPVFALSSAVLEEQLLTQFPEVVTASVRLGLPNEMNITVTERVPVLAWEMNGQTEYVDSYGYAFPVRSGILDPSYLLVQADSLPQFITITEQVSGTQEQSQSAAGSDGSEKTDQEEPGKVQKAQQSAAHQIMSPETVISILVLSRNLPPGTVLLYSERHGLGWKDAAGWEVYFGDISDIEQKLIVYRGVVNLLDYRQIKPVLISVEQVHMPYFRMER